jgi:hypothetical protein
LSNGILLSKRQEIKNIMNPKFHEVFVHNKKWPLPPFRLYKRILKNSTIFVTIT